MKPHLLTAFALAVALAPAAALTVERAPGPVPEPPLPGIAVAGFEDDAPWRTVNDNVMGGRSIGGFELEAGVLVFSGSINTNGGGFSSVYHPLEPGVLEGTDRLLLRVRAVDDRPYRVNLRDRLPGRRDRVLHRCELPITEPGVWQTVEVRYADLVPSVRGDPVKRPAFDPALAVELGLILNDTGDGPFRLEVSEIRAVGDVKESDASASAER